MIENLERKQIVEVMGPYLKAIVDKAEQASQDANNENLVAQLQTIITELKRAIATSEELKALRGKNSRFLVTIGGVNSAILVDATQVNAQAGDGSANGDEVKITVQALEEQAGV